MAYAVSLAGFLVALFLLHRLTTIERGERYAWAGVREASKGLGELASGTYEEGRPLPA